MTDDGWAVTPKPAPPELAEGFPHADYVAPEPLHIRDWVSFAEKLDADQLKLLMGYSTIGG